MGRRQTKLLRNLLKRKWTGALKWLQHKLKCVNGQGKPITSRTSETRRGHDSHLQGPNRVQTNAELPRKLLETMPLVLLVL
jgi:hypothetical protein